MRNTLALIGLCLALGACATPKVPATYLEKANVLPLQINDNFQFRKIRTYYNQGARLQRTGAVTSEVMDFEQRRMEWGAVSNYDKSQRFGNYFWFYWRTREEADVTVRLEYRQAALGNFVLAQERYYPAARGSLSSEFTVIGDEYLEGGRVTAWRALLIVDGRIVALTQSFMWR